MQHSVLSFHLNISVWSAERGGDKDDRREREAQKGQVTESWQLVRKRQTKRVIDKSRLREKWIERLTVRERTTQRSSQAFRGYLMWFAWIMIETAICVSVLYCSSWFFCTVYLHRHPDYQEVWRRLFLVVRKVCRQPLMDGNSLTLWQKQQQQDRLQCWQ